MSFQRANNLKQPRALHFVSFCFLALIRPWSRALLALFWHGGASLSSFELGISLRILDLHENCNAAEMIMRLSHCGIGRSELHATAAMEEPDGRSATSEYTEREHITESGMAALH